MNVLCAWTSVISLFVGIGYSIQRENIEYMIEFVLGAMFVIGIYAAVTI